MGRHKRMEDDELLARVREIVVKEGVNVSSRRIAEHIGMSSAVLFQRFQSKENLVFAAMVPPLPDLDALLGKSAKAADARAWLEQIMGGLLDYFRELVRVLAPLTSHPSFHYSEMKKHHDGSPLETLMHALHHAFDEKARAKELACDDVGALILQIISVTHSLATFELMGVHGGTFDRQLVSRLTELVWRGVAPPDERVKRRAKRRPKAAAKKRRT
jgi:AcrR family transcriptional regulator